MPDAATFRDVLPVRASVAVGNPRQMHGAAGTVSAILAAPFEKNAGQRIRANENSDEAALIRTAQRGDQEAFERLVRTYDQSVLRLAMNLLRSPDEARDVYQEAFLKVYKNLHLFRFDCSFHTWLYRIVTNVCLDHLRRRKVRKEESTVVETPDGPVDQVTRLAEEGPAANPERQMWNRELSEGIIAALEGLTPRERTVFELRHYEGLRLRAIGDILGTTEEAAKNCLFRATQKMRSSLETFV
jgi:RNA polymerase sigma-70 factor, ECF subfamily